MKCFSASASSCSCWTGRASRVSRCERRLFPQKPANNRVSRGDRSCVKRTSCCLHTMDEISSETLGFCCLNVWNKMSGAFFSPRWQMKDLQMVLLPACLFADWHSSATHTLYFTHSQVQKLDCSHSFSCRCVTIKYPQVELLCFGGVKNCVCVFVAKTEKRKQNNKGTFFRQCSYTFTPPDMHTSNM